MKVYEIGERLEHRSAVSALTGARPFAAILSPEEWEEHGSEFGIETDDPVTAEPFITKAEVGADSLTGSFSLLDKSDMLKSRSDFAFAMNENGMVFIDDSGYSARALDKLRVSRKWRSPSLARFFYDFLEQIISDDMKYIQEYEAGLEDLEDSILADEMDNVLGQLNTVRGDLLDIRTEYDQLIDLGIELEENENGFFDEEGLRLFHLFTSRVERYREQVLSIRDYTSQIRDLYQSQMDLKQNKAMNILTVVTSLFLPLSLITGWYGMNFVHMPELKWPWAYFALIGLCFCIVLTELLIYRKKKLL